MKRIMIMSLMLAMLLLTGCGKKKTTNTTSISGASSNIIQNNIDESEVVPSCH